MDATVTMEVTLTAMMEVTLVTMEATQKMEVNLVTMEAALAMMRTLAARTRMSMDIVSPNMHGYAIRWNMNGSPRTARTYASNVGTETAVSAKTRISMDTVVTNTSLHAITPATLLGSNWTARSCAGNAKKVPIVVQPLFP